MSVALSVTWFWILIVIALLVVGTYSLRVIQAKRKIHSVFVVAGVAVLAIGISAKTVASQYDNDLQNWQAFRASWTQSLSRTIELNSRDSKVQFSIVFMPEILNISATTGELQQVVLVSSTPDGKMPIVSAYDPGSVEKKSSWERGASAYSKAWAGKPQILPTGNAYDFAFPVKGQDGKIHHVLIAQFDATGAIKRSKQGTANLSLVCSLATLFAIGLAALFFESNHNLSAQRVAKAQLQLQQDQIKEQIKEITERTQQMAQHQDLLSRANSKLHQLATTDGLTGVMNHRTLMEFLAKSIAQSGEIGAPVSIILLDVDNFKQLNDQYGHIAGDEALRTIAQVLQQSCPKNGAVGRYGGEEFLVILPGASESVIETVAEELRKRIQMAKMTSRTCTASFGASTVYSMSKSDQALIDEADQALYQAKKNGKNCVIHFGHGLLDSA